MADSISAARYQGYNNNDVSFTRTGSPDTGGGEAHIKQSQEDDKKKRLEHPDSPSLAMKVLASNPKIPTDYSNF